MLELRAVVVVEEVEEEVEQHVEQLQVFQTRLLIRRGVKAHP